jgi:RND family efflux transporter MFP subunit
VETGVRQAEQARAEARSALPEVQNAIAAAKAQLDLANATFQRMKTLFDQKSVTNQEFDEASARRNMAEANYEMAAAKRAQLEARIRQAEEAVAQAQVMKSYTEIPAPFAGVVTERKAEPGTLASPGMPLLMIEQTGAYRLEAQVEEAQIAKVRPGGKAVVELEALGKTLELRVGEISPAIDPMSRTFTAKIDLPGFAGLRGGLFGRVHFPVGERMVMLVPVPAVVAQGQLRKVFVNENGQARARFVTLGATAGDRVEVLSGVAGGDRVVNPAPAGLADGARIEVRP